MVLFKIGKSYTLLIDKNIVISLSGLAMAFYSFECIENIVRITH